MSFKKIISRILAGALILLLVSSCGADKAPSLPEVIAYPTERPELTPPERFELTDLADIFQNQVVEIDSDVTNCLFQDCDVRIACDDIRISGSEFVNSTVSLVNRSNIVFDKVTFRSLNQYEKAALSLYECDDIVIQNSQLFDNYIGLGIHSSSAEVLANRFERNNGHNALVIGEGSSVKVTGNYFYGSFPHAMLVMNREGSPEACVDINHNLIDQTGEDAIDFEDYRNSASGNVSDNVITNSGWSALIVEYNSWEASITIRNNWIEGTGIDWKLTTHPLQPDYFQCGWGHGVLIEDSSEVQIINNRVLLASENGIEIKNSREVLVQGNGISCSKVGIGVHGYNDASLYRDFSPLAQEDADGSYVITSGNVIHTALRDYEVDERSQLLYQ